MKNIKGAHHEPIGIDVYDLVKDIGIYKDEKIAEILGYTHKEVEKLRTKVIEKYRPEVKE